MDETKKRIELQNKEALEKQRERCWPPLLALKGFALDFIQNTNEKNSDYKKYDQRCAELCNVKTLRQAVSFLYELEVHKSVIIKRMIESLGADIECDMEEEGGC